MNRSFQNLIRVAISTSVLLLTLLLAMSDNGWVDSAMAQTVPTAAPSPQPTKISPTSEPDESPAPDPDTPEVPTLSATATASSSPSPSATYTRSAIQSPTTTASSTSTQTSTQADPTQASDQTPAVSVEPVPAKEITALLPYATVILLAFGIWYLFIRKRR